MTRSKTLVLAFASLLTFALLLGILAVSVQAMNPSADPPPALREMSGEGPWSGWWLDDLWTVDAEGGLVGDSSAMQGYPLERHHLRYALPPADAPDGDYRATLDLALTRGTLYLGILAEDHPAGEQPFGCGAIVFPLANRLSGPALDVRACRMAGVIGAEGLQRPLWDVTEYGGMSRPITAAVTGNRVQLIIRDSAIYDVEAPRDRGGLFLALGPQTQVRIASFTWE